MIKSAEISNFRCYEAVSIEQFSRVNVLVGDNGSGKTALLEAIFLALANSPEVATRYRTIRGLDGNVTGVVNAVERALWMDLFYKGDMKRAIIINLAGDGHEKRSLRISESVPTTRIVSIHGAQFAAGIEKDQSSIGGVRFLWVDHKGVKHSQRASMTASGLKVDFIENTYPEPYDDRYYYISSAGSTGVNENATRFSELCMRGEKDDFLSVFTKEYSWITDISIQMHGGIGTLYAHVAAPDKSMRPLAYVSGGISRVLSILLCIASARNGVVIVDEIDNGIYHEHHGAVWRMLLSMSKKYNAQLILSTHSAEWLAALAPTVVDDLQSVSLWRVEREENGVAVRQFAGKQAMSAIQLGTDVR